MQDDDPSTIAAAIGTAISIVTLALLIATGGAEAAEPARSQGAQLRRLQFSVELDRRASGQHAGEQGTSVLAQRLQFSAVLRSDGVPALHNPLDPDAGRQLAERGQRTQAKVNAALARHGQSVPAQPDMAAMQSMQARAQQMQARCGQDRECLMREAFVLSSAQVAAGTGGNAGVQARLQGYGQAVQACERQHAKAAAREACIADARRRAGGADDSDSGDDDAETPYLHFFGQAECKLDAAAKIDERTSGHFQDVQGRVGFTETRQGEQRLREATLCPLLQAVLDTRNGRLWVHAMHSLPGFKAVTVRQEQGRTADRQEGQMDLQWHEGTEWLRERMTRLGARGEDRLQRAAGAGGNGQLTIKLRWSFEPA